MTLATTQNLNAAQKNTDYNDVMYPNKEDIISDKDNQED